MKLEIFNCSRGRYNLLSNEQSFSFSMGIVDDERKVIRNENNVAKIEFSTEDEINEDDFDFTNLSYVFQECSKYANRVWGSTDYKGNLKFFFKTYKENFEEIKKNFEEKRKKEIQKEIEELTRKLNYVELCDESDDMATPFLKQIKNLEKWIEYAENEIEDFKEGSESYIKTQEKINTYEEEKRELELLISPVAP